MGKLSRSIAGVETGTVRPRRERANTSGETFWMKRLAIMTPPKMVERKFEQQE